MKLNNRTITQKGSYMGKYIACHIPGMKGPVRTFPCWWAGLRLHNTTPYTAFTLKHGRFATGGSQRQLQSLYND